MELILKSDLPVISKVITSEIIYNKDTKIISGINEVHIAKSIYFILRHYKVKVIINEIGITVIDQSKISQNLTIYDKLMIHHLKLNKPYSLTILLNKYNNKKIYIYLYILMLAFKKLNNLDIEFNSLFLLNLGQINSLTVLESDNLSKTSKINNINNLDFLALIDISLSSFLSKLSFDSIIHLFLLSSKLLKKKQRKLIPFKDLNLKSKPGLLKEIKKEAKEKIQSKNIKVKRILQVLRENTEKYNTSLGCTSYFHQNWNKENSDQAKHMLLTIDEEEIIKAINWFFNDKYWRGKVFDLKMVSKHYQKFLSNNRTSTSNSNLLSDAINRRTNGTEV